MNRKDMFDFMKDNLKIQMYNDSVRIHGELKSRLNIELYMRNDDGEVINIDRDYMYLEDLK